MENIILGVVLAAIIGAATAYIVRAKRKGQKCIGCPYGKSCSKGGSCCNKE